MLLYTCTIVACLFVGALIGWAFAWLEYTDGHDEHDEFQVYRIPRR